MKKKLLVLVLVLAMAVSMAVPAMAAEPTLVTNYAQLKAAIEDPDVAEIVISGTLLWGSNPTIVVDREVSITGLSASYPDNINWSAATSPAAGFNGQKHFRVTEDGVLTLNNIILQGNASSNQKGGVEVVGGTLIMNGARLSNCGHSAGYANGPVSGGILMNGGTLVMNDCIIGSGYSSSTSNTYRSSGILAINGATVILSNTSFSSNQLVNPSYSNSNSSIQTDGTAYVWFGENVTFNPGTGNGNNQNYAKRGDGIVSWNHADDIKDANRIFTVTFDSNGGSEVESQTVCFGEKAVQPDDPTLEGYLFLGWFLDGEKFDFETEVDANITLVAEYELIYLVEVTPSAFVTKLNGNKNELTVTVEELYSDGAICTFTETFMIDNNAVGTYEVGLYKVYVDTKGNTQIRACYIVE